MDDTSNEEVNSKFDYNKTPLAPLGYNGLIYNDLAICASWAPNGINAYYIGPALKHYWCIPFHICTTRQHQEVDMWQLYPMHCVTPTLSPAERTIQQATDILTALGSTVPTATSASIACTQAIQKLREILLPTLHQGTTNPLATEMPSPRVLHP